MKITNKLIALILIIGLNPLVNNSLAVQQPGDCRTFIETNTVMCEPFLKYWNGHGELAQFGYPISNPLDEVSVVDGHIYTVQYFERAVFELHPENSSPYNVLLSLLGTLQYKQKYRNGVAHQSPNDSEGSILFPETGKRLGGWFLDYWRANGDLVQYGFPISDEFVETSELNNKPYLVQYFQRAVFELHPENAPPDNVLLSQLSIYRRTILAKAMSKITEEARQELSQDSTKKVCYFAVLAEQADTSNDIKDWDEKGRYVFNKLQEVVNRTQPPVIALLKEQQTVGNVDHFEGFYIINAIAVRGNLVSALSIASLLEMGSIEASKCSRP